MPEITVIVPVYNIAPYLPKCIDSLTRQTFEDFEVILVNDGSSDDSPEICRRIALQDARFRVIEQTNGGASKARNEGISSARGHYISFVDGDDYVLEFFLEQLYRSIVDNHAEISICGIQCVDTACHPIPSPFSNNQVPEKVTPREAVGWLGRNLVFGVVWNKLYRKGDLIMDTVLTNAKEKMNKTISALTSTLNSIRAGRANAAVLDPIRVDYWGTPTPINQMAQITVAEARILVIQPWDKSALKLIEKAIQASDLGINPQNDGTVLRLAFPPLTEERRKMLTKDIKNEAESSKVAVRNIRRDAIEKLKALKKNGELTEDDLKDAEKEAQKLTDDFVKQIDSIAAKKEEEIMTI